MKTYSAIKAEIAKLEKQAEALRKAELTGVIDKIKEAIATYALTQADLGFGVGAAKAVRAPVAKSARKTSTTIGVAKYRDPKSGKTWTGRGKPPAWIVGVKSRDAYLIAGQTAEAASETSPKRAAGNRKARGAAPAPRKAKSARSKSPRARRTMAAAPVKTPAVQIESGAATE